MSLDALIDDYCLCGSELDLSFIEIYPIVPQCDEFENKTVADKSDASLLSLANEHSNLD